jgi:hypothetical protein
LKGKHKKEKTRKTQETNQIIPKNIRIPPPKGRKPNKKRNYPRKERWRHPSVATAAAITS